MHRQLVYIIQADLVCRGQQPPARPDKSGNCVQCKIRQLSMRNIVSQFSATVVVSKLHTNDSWYNVIASKGRLY